MLNKLKQYLKSWTINFGLLLQIAATVQTYYEGLGDPRATAIVGIIIILLRFKTNMTKEYKKSKAHQGI